MSAPLRPPWAFVPTLYFAEGLPYILVTGLSVVVFKRFGVSNEQIGLWTSLIAFPWMLKPLWAPVVELTLTRRRWVLLTQCLLFLALLALPAAFAQPQFLAPSLAVLTAIAFLSATHDAAADGFYMQALAEREQSRLVGVRTTCYRLAIIFTTGYLVAWAGRWERAGAPQRFGFPGCLATDPLVQAWLAALGVAALSYGLMLLLNAVLLPNPPPAPATARPRVPFLAALSAFFRRRGILAILAFILCYRLGEALIGKMSAPFLLDTRLPAYAGSFEGREGVRGTLQEALPDGRLRLQVIEPAEWRGREWLAGADEVRSIGRGGGLEVPTATQGWISGTLGIVALVAGGILGGLVIARSSLRRCLWPMVLCMNAPNLLYALAATAQPGTGAVAGLVALDQFGNGFGFSAFTVYLLQISQDTPYPTSSYAIATGLMALGIQGAGIASGYLQAALGYADFFWAACLLSVPGILTLFFLPVRDPRDRPPAAA